MSQCQPGFHGQQAFEQLFDVVLEADVGRASTGRDDVASGLQCQDRLAQPLRTAQQGQLASPQTTTEVDVQRR